MERVNGNAEGGINNSYKQGESQEEKGEYEKTIKESDSFKKMSEGLQVSDDNGL